MSGGGALLKVGQTVYVRIVKPRIYKIHLVDIENANGIEGALIVARHDTKFYYKGLRVRARVLRIDNMYVDLVAL
uniref:Viral ubiquitin like protein n=1 Tax=Lymantria dispar multicapsid nuclear polyhedrosis virus TaxID=10449 RepID=A0A1B1MQR1_NPVLD|nr:viral ubiquitin like protein [Lymantria dispar multiple nucleopolyhedrovirus]